MELRNNYQLEIFYESMEDEPPDWVQKLKERSYFSEIIDGELLFYLKVSELKSFFKIKIPLDNLTDNALLSLVFQRIPIGVLIFKENVIYANAFMEKVFEKPKEKIVNFPIKNFLPAELGENIQKLLSKKAFEQKLILKWIGKFSFLPASNEFLIIATSTMVNESPLGVAIFVDVSGEKRFLNKVLGSTSEDLSECFSNLRKALEIIGNLKRGGKQFLLALMDIDNFSVINDSFGVEVGDKILAEFWERLKTAFDSKLYFVLRTISDRFLIVSLRERERLRKVKYIVEKVKRVLETPFVINGSEVFLSVNFGFSFYPEHGDSILTKAEIALKHAREEKVAFAIYSPELEISRESLEILSKIKEDIKNNRIEVFFQPKVSLYTGKIVGAEALMRSSVPPAKAIPVIIRYGLMFDIGKIIFRKSLENLKIWLEEGHDVSVAVNVSISQILDSRFLPFVFKMIEKLKVPSSKLTLKISIDDFGTGYSSLSRLKIIKANELKIDVSFVKGVPESEEDSSIVKFIVDISKLLKMSSVAEGIERKEQLDFLKSIGCTEGHGFYFSPALPSSEFRKLLKEKSFVV
ncbi:MAG: bifunctional diguanylate cyclase/phosphodiesterase [Desulfurobacteriaceae bacterium]